MTSSASFNYSDDSSIRSLKPQAWEAQRFLFWFSHYWNYILSLTPEAGERPGWQMYTKYPIEPRDFWELFIDEEVLVGVNFGKFTKYIMSDIDIKSKNHPDNDRERYDGVLKAMEGIGLSRPIVTRSSDSGGLHVYWFLAEEVHSYTLAITAKRALNKAEQKYQLRDGQLELFPNPKDYDVERVTSHKPHRVPLQQGSYILDWDLMPISSSISTFLDWADWSSAGQDMTLLEESMQRAQEIELQERTYYRKRTSIEQFHNDLLKQQQIGWTSYGQTNFLLLKFAMYGIIFEGLQGKELVQWMVNVCLNAPGYQRFCRHTHEIEKRCKHWAKCAQKKYYPYPGKPPRDKTFKESFGGELGENNIIPFAKAKQLRQDNIRRLWAVVQELKGQGAYPQDVNRRMEAIRKEAQAKHRKGFSPTTLYRKEYIYLWHPRFDALGIEFIDGVNPDFYVSLYPQMPDPWLEVQKYSPKEETKQSKGLHHFGYTEGLLMLAPAKELEETVITAVVGIETERCEASGEATRPEAPAEGELGLELPLDGEENVNTPIAPKLNLILTISILFQIVSSLINSITSHLNSLPKTINSNTQELISESVNNLISELISFNNFTSFHNSNSSNFSNSVIEGNLVIQINARLDSTNRLVFWHLLSRHVLVRPSLLIQTQILECLFSLSGDGGSLSTPKSSYIPSKRLESALDASIGQGENNLKLDEAADIISGTGQEFSKTESNQAEGQLPDIETVISPETEVSLLQFKAQLEKMQQEAKARQLLKGYCQQLNQKPTLDQQLCLKNILHHCLLLKSSYQSLRQEAQEWMFVASDEIVTQLGGLVNSFWSYLESLNLEIPF